ncbi:hypothetical protein DIPPA_07550 [Diplonema papillatum]|nr:hypothetical protein DIPPA_07550 [Diplonema papillatum]
MGGKSSKGALQDPDDFYVAHGLRRPTKDRKACSVCSVGFGWCTTPSFCQLCGKPLCGECVVQRKVLNQGKPLVEACRTCNPLPGIELPRYCPEGWRNVISFLPPADVNAVIQSCRTLQLAHPLPYPRDRWDLHFERPVYLACGAYGAVNKAYHKRLKKEVAVKVLKKKNVFSLRRWAGIMREFETHLAAEHPHAVQILEPFILQTKNELLIVMELAQCDLFDRVVKGGPLSEPDASSFAKQLLLFLHDFHAAGFVHRDVKPENLLLVRDEHQELILKIADFGFARRYPSIPSAADRGSGVLSPTGKIGTTAGRGGGATATMPVPYPGGRNADNFVNGVPYSSTPVGVTSCTPCGTYGFAAPELIDKNRRVVSEKGGRKSAVKVRVQNAHLTGLDIFAAGVVVHIMLTGCEPFPCRSTTEHIRSVRLGLRLHLPVYQSLSANAIDFMTQMMCYDPSERPSAAHLLQHPWIRRQERDTEFIATPTKRRVTCPPQSVTSVEEEIAFNATTLLPVRDREKSIIGTSPRLTLSPIGVIVLNDAKSPEPEPVAVSPKAAGPSPKIPRPPKRAAANGSGSQDKQSLLNSRALQSYGSSLVHEPLLPVNGTFSDRGGEDDHSADKLPDDMLAESFESYPSYDGIPQASSPNSDHSAEAVHLVD